MKSSGSKLDAYAKQIEAWLAECEDLTAVRLHEKLRAEGFDGVPLQAVTDTMPGVVLMRLLDTFGYVQHQSMY